MCFRNVLGTYQEHSVFQCSAQNKWYVLGIYLEFLVLYGRRQKNSAVLVLNTPFQMIGFSMEGSITFLLTTSFILSTRNEFLADRENYQPHLSGFSLLCQTGACLKNGILYVSRKTHLILASFAVHFDAHKLLGAIGPILSLHWPIFV